MVEELGSGEDEDGVNKYTGSGHGDADHRSGAGESAGEGDRGGDRENPNSTTNGLGREREPQRRDDEHVGENDGADTAGANVGHGIEEGEISDGIGEYVVESEIVTGYMPANSTDREADVLITNVVVTRATAQVTNLAGAPEMVVAVMELTGACLKCDNAHTVDTGTMLLPVELLPFFIDAFKQVQEGTINEHADAWTDEQLKKILDGR